MLVGACSIGPSARRSAENGEIGRDGARDVLKDCEAEDAFVEATSEGFECAGGLTSERLASGEYLVLSAWLESEMLVLRATPKWLGSET